MTHILLFRHVYPLLTIRVPKEMMDNSKGHLVEGCPAEYVVDRDTGGSGIKINLALRKHLFCCNTSSNSYIPSFLLLLLLLLLRRMHNFLRGISLLPMFSLSYFPCELRIPFQGHRVECHYIVY